MSSLTAKHNPVAVVALTKPRRIPSRGTAQGKQRERRHCRPAGRAVAQAYATQAEVETSRLPLSILRSCMHVYPAAGIRFVMRKRVTDGFCLTANVVVAFRRD